MLTFKDIITIIIVAVALYIYGRYCYNNGFDDALNARIAGVYKMGSDKDDDDEELIEVQKNQIGKCENCLYKIMDMETGELECGNADSPAFGNKVSGTDTCDAYYYFIHLEDGRKKNDN